MVDLRPKPKHNSDANCYYYAYLLFPEKAMWANPPGYVFLICNVFAGNLEQGNYLPSGFLLFGDVCAKLRR